MPYTAVRNASDKLVDYQSIYFGELMIHALPADPFTGTIAPYSHEYVAAATKIKETNSLVPYSLEHLESIGITPSVLEGAK